MAKMTPNQMHNIQVKAAALRKASGTKKPKIVISYNLSQKEAVKKAASMVLGKKKPTVKTKSKKKK